MCAAPSQPSAAPLPPVDLVPVAFADLDGFDVDDHGAALAAFIRTARAICAGEPPLRGARPANAALEALCRAALDNPPPNPAAARRFFTENFRPFRVGRRDDGFLTGYFEPVVAGLLAASAEFSVPVLARPDDLVTLAPEALLPDPLHGLAAARRLADGRLVPYPERAAIEAGAIATHTRPVAWLRDRLELFLVQVQGSARISLPDGTMRRLVYAGRNGQPYTSVGRLLVERGEVPAAQMGLARLKQWVDAHGLGPGEAGAALLARNKSYVFFALQEPQAEQEPQADADEPIGGAGVPLVPLRSIAIDRGLWSYGLPFWISAALPWQGEQSSPFNRLLIAQDTGSAILGPARADIFFGTGDLAGARAGEIRHSCEFIVLLPRADGEGL